MTHDERVRRRYLRIRVFDGIAWVVVVAFVAVGALHLASSPLGEWRVALHMLVILVPAVSLGHCLGGYYRFRRRYYEELRSGRA